MRLVTGTLVSYYFYCKRRLWLHANDIRFEDTSEDVAMGKLIEETTYLRRNSNYEQIELEGIKIDFYDRKNKVIHETKKSSKFEHVQVWQLKYYIYILRKNGIKGVTGLLEYPAERKTYTVELNEEDTALLEKVTADILDMVQNSPCPPVIKNARCKNCSYYEFCYVTEEE